MEAPPETKVCEACGRRFTRVAIIETGRCPLCGGNLVPLDQGPYEDPPLRKGEDENGNH